MPSVIWDPPTSASRLKVGKRYVQKGEQVELTDDQIAQIARSWYAPVRVTKPDDTGELRSTAARLPVPVVRDQRGTPLGAKEITDEVIDDTIAKERERVIGRQAGRARRTG